MGMTTVKMKDGHLRSTVRKWRRGNRGVQLRIAKRIYKEIATAAKADSLPIAAWIRYACTRELRRRKASL